MQIVEAPPSVGAKRSRRRGQCGELRKFKTLFTLRVERLFATLLVFFLHLSSAGVHPPDVCTGFALVTWCLFIYSYTNGMADAKNVGKMAEIIPANFLRVVARRSKGEISVGNARIIYSHKY